MTAYSRVRHSAAGSAAGNIPHAIRVLTAMTATSLLVLQSRNAPLMEMNL
jgi:hypothetical protein